MSTFTDNADLLDLGSFGEEEGVSVAADLSPEQLAAVALLDARLTNARTGEGRPKSLEGTAFYYGFRGSTKASGAGVAGLYHYIQSNWGVSDRKVAEGCYALGLPLRASDKVVNATGGIDWVRTLARCLQSNGVHWAALQWALADGSGKRRPVLYQSKGRGWSVDLDGHARRKGVTGEEPVHLPHQIEDFKARLHAGLAAFHVHRGGGNSIGFADDGVDTVDPEPSTTATTASIDPEMLAKLLKLAEAMGLK
jgi:hypothetical protein